MMEKAKSVFPAEAGLLKILCLAMMDITKKWTGRRIDWGQILAQLCVYCRGQNPGMTPGNK